MEVLIVGAGAMGRWLGGVIDATITYADIDPDAAAHAATATGGSVRDLTDLGVFDVVCIAVPMPAVEAAIQTHAENATTAVVDVTGIMTAPVATMTEYAPDLERLSLHPLFAPENAPGQIAVVHDARGPATNAIREALTAHGNQLFETTPAEHDRAMETVQAKTHAAVLAFALAAEDVPEDFGTPVYDGLRELVAEMLDGTPRVYADIQTAFDGADAIAAAAAEIAAADHAKFERLYRNARE